MRPLGSRHAAGAMARQTAWKRDVNGFGQGCAAGMAGVARAARCGGSEIVRAAGWKGGARGVDARRCWAAARKESN